GHRAGARPRAPRRRAHHPRRSLTPPHGADTPGGSLPGRGRPRCEDGRVMRLSLRQIPTVLPGVRGTLRAERPTKALLPRLQPRDIAVIDHTDRDRTTARALIDAEVVAVVNVRPMVSGRYPNRGPEMLAEAGVEMLDGIGEAGYTCLADGRKARLHDGAVY